MQPIKSKFDKYSSLMEDYNEQLADREPLPDLQLAGEVWQDTYPMLHPVNLIRTGASANYLPSAGFGTINSSGTSGVGGAE